MARLPRLRAIDALKHPYYKGIKVLFPAQISVKLNEFKRAARKIDDRKISGNFSGKSFFVINLSEQNPERGCRYFLGSRFERESFSPPNL